ncbi:GDSL esterase/lipase At1g58430-like [Citrus sinensis]|uniref:GDSL esterase/lipase At1g58430-like n=1 Tax=Citrus sinensis TaxID=2711 RepID=UPI000D62BC00|nr:GDSL esterase/lipase At1g58430-like [Citrus sinensis]
MTFNYYDIPTRRAQFNISEYQDFLQTKLHNYINQLYDLGCRQMIVAGLPPIGCLPIQITARFKNPLDRKCLDEQNTDSQSYNQKLIKLLNQLQASLPGTRLNYADVYEPVIEMK